MRGRAQSTVKGMCSTPPLCGQGARRLQEFAPHSKFLERGVHVSVFICDRDSNHANVAGVTTCAQHLRANAVGPRTKISFLVCGNRLQDKS